MESICTPWKPRNVCNFLRKPLDFRNEWADRFVELVRTRGFPDNCVFLWGLRSWKDGPFLKRIYFYHEGGWAANHLRPHKVYCWELLGEQLVRKMERYFAKQAASTSLPAQSECLLRPLRSMHCIEDALRDLQQSIENSLMGPWNGSNSGRVVVKLELLLLPQARCKEVHSFFWREAHSHWDDAHNRSSRDAQTFDIRTLDCRLGCWDSQLRFRPHETKLSIFQTLSVRFRPGGYPVTDKGQRCGERWILWAILLLNQATHSHSLKITAACALVAASPRSVRIHRLLNGKIPDELIVLLRHLERLRRSWSPGNYTNYQRSLDRCTLLHHSRPPLPALE